MNINDEIAGLMARVLNDEATPEEIKRLTDFLRENKEAAQQFERLRKIWPSKTGNESSATWTAGWQEPERLTRLRAKAREERANAILSEPPPALVKRLWPSILKYAAAVLVIATGALFYYRSEINASKKSGASRTEVAAEYGSRKRVMLPDGTTVLLNSGSKLQYCNDFEGKTRDVILFGEAFFDVVKQPQRPFIVHAGNINIKVLGTAFNVKSYPDEDAIETTLIRGLVQINRIEQTEAQPIFLHPNQKVTLPRCLDCADKSKANQPGKAPAPKKEIKIETLGSGDMEQDWVETAWIHNRLEFRKNSFRDISKKMERWYGVQIHINDEKLAGETFNGSFENETLEQALTALQKTTPFTFNINNNEVFIDPSK